MSPESLETKLARMEERLDGMKGTLEEIKDRLKMWDMRVWGAIGAALVALATALLK
jgi:hypothetical protein